jgi:hypothetical protein
MEKEVFPARMTNEKGILLGDRHSGGGRSPGIVIGKGLDTGFRRYDE